jgi:two-component system, cell cycle sensor histidine kinase and response regulator CckA
MNSSRSDNLIRPHHSGQEVQETCGIKQMGKLFDLLGPDPEHNIHIIVRHTSEVIESSCSLYNRLDDQGASLKCWSGHNLPANFSFDGSPAGYICYEATIKGGQGTVALEDLSKTPYQQSDPLVARYGLKSYLGHPVRCNGQVVGALAVVDTQPRQFSEMDLHFIATLAKALSLEEERLRMQKGLSQSEQKYKALYKMVRLLADNVPDLLWAKDLEDRYLFANQAMCDNVLKCRYPDEATGKTDLYFAQQERRAGHEHTFDEICLESDNVVKTKMSPGRFLAEGLVHNQRKILDIHKAPFWGPAGELIGTVGCGRDVTQEQQTKNALHESERRYRDLYHNTPVMLCSIDINAKLTSASNLWLETLGFQRQEVIGRSIFDFFAPESRRNALEISFPELYQSGEIKSRPFTLLTQSGELRTVLFSAMAERDAQGQYKGALAFAVDITEAKRAEMDTHRLSARLQQAQKMEAIATLAGGVAHQFNNALAVIMGNLELIHIDGLEDEKINCYLKPISQAGQKMVQLTSQLLAYARGGRFQTHTIAAHRFVSEALLMIKHTIAPHVALETDLDETTDHIEVDQTQMQMLLAAILSNASEAIETQGEVCITLMNTRVSQLECQRCPGLKPGRHVLLRIADNGKGMDEQTRSRIFEPFFTTKFQGRGLGMAAVYGIVKKHGGYVYVDATAGEGTTVSIYLPGVAPKVEIAEKPEAYEAKGRGTALVVEDEELVMEVNRAIVEKMGYQVLEAKTGAEAIKVVNSYEGTIDFALLDVILPDMDGSHIYPQMMAARPDLKVIVCSGFALDGPARHILDSGAQSFVQKPFTMASLSAILRKIFNTPE